MGKQVQGGYVVVENMPGFLPESEPELVFTKRDAVSRLASHRDNLREDGYRVYGRCSDLTISARRNEGAWQGADEYVVEATYYDRVELISLGWQEEVEAHEAGK